MTMTLGEGGALLTRVSLASIGGVLLGWAFLQASAFMLAWIAYVPLLIAVKGASRRTAYFCALAFGFLMFALGAYWLKDVFVTFAGAQWQAWAIAVTCWALAAHTIVAVIFLDRFLGRVQMVSAPVRFALCASIIPMLAPTLFPAQLSATQSAFGLALQGVALTGPLGLDFLMALVAATLSCWVLGTISRPMAAGVAGLCGLWLVYGGISSSLWAARADSADMLRIGIVQPNDAPTGSAEERGYGRAFPAEMAMTKQLAAAGAKLVIWPEARPRHYLDDGSVQATFRRHLEEVGTHILLQDGKDAGEGAVYNAGALVNPSGEIVGVHQKAKLMPFGETLSYLDALPSLSEKAKRFFGDLYRPTRPGAGPTAIATSELGPLTHIVPLICYETIFSTYVAEGVPDAEGAPIIVGLTYNGWFGKTLQPIQHARTTALRAVENRAVFINATNNGPSTVYLPDGSRHFITPLDQAGGYIVDIPVIASARPLYSHYPRVVPTPLIAVVILLGAVRVVQGLRPAKNS